MQPVCLTIGGSDSCGGAGIQADLRIFAQAGIKGCSAITALTAQNPGSISRIEPVSVAQLAAEIDAIFSYYDVAAIKTGMLVDAEHVACIAGGMERHADDSRALVVDPVMVASSGKALLDEAGRQTLTARLFPLATLITPNLPEAEQLLGHVILDPVEDAAELALQYRANVLLKGGHRDGDQLTDVLVSREGEVHLFHHPRREWGAERSHGTGCRLASGIAAGIATGRELADAVRYALDLLESID